ncbi:hypothetical protein GRI89_09375 [Altererythrobacter salegens]|uniref:SMODS and SLOG-associating 2TM effector domain-containing protein n=1 Tax=Croceibacterium salegens TaxID=1737568 RepID=A0A6I4SW45_9SPHN|nr:hypothetical protein [Croceibacterium salegens]MXO59748.1 hypothetical protein [Croceibacterium salegens]
MDTADEALNSLVSECNSVANKSTLHGRRYYFFSYLLMVLSVAGSILAGGLALWGEFDKAVIGTVALLPALAATVAGQLRLVEKANWHYRRRNRMRELGRDFALMRARGANLDTLEEANRKMTMAEARMEHEWVQTNSFHFDTDQAAS